MSKLFRIPAMVPRLPQRAACAGYLDQMDANRWYSNFGPLADALAARLAVHYRAERAAVCLASNATSALAAVLQDFGDARPDATCLMPSWTFAATAHAARLAGLKPKFVDVDRTTGQLTPEIAARSLDAEVAAVVVVSPFGAGVAPEPWEEFAAKHGVKVVIDAAAAFDTVNVSTVPNVVSMHATKPVAAGEGGFVLCSDTDLIERVRRRTNFGFDAARVSRYWGMNAKLSEYAAAIGLAALDAWPRSRAQLLAIAARYSERLAPLPLVLQPGWGQSWISTTLNVRLAEPIACSAPEVSQRLAQFDIDARQWWGAGCHTHPAFASCGASDLTHTEDWVDRTIGLPFHADLAFSDLDEVVERLDTILTDGSGQGRRSI